MEEWMEKYRELLFDSDQSLFFTVLAARLKFAHMPDRLYKYRCFSENHIDALKKGVLYFTATNKLNETKEANIYITDQAEAPYYQSAYNEWRLVFGWPAAKVSSYLDLICKSVSAIIGQNVDIEELKRNPLLEAFNQQDRIRTKELFEKEQATARARYSVCCFSKNNNSNKMWSHYADGHTGFCIEYGFKTFGLDDLTTAYLFPVMYVKDNRLFIDDLDQIDGNKALLAASIKEEEWKYEEEWRYILPVREDGRALAMPKPTAIYLGERASEQNAIIIKEYCSDNAIPAYRMKYNQQNNMIEAYEEL